MLQHINIKELAVVSSLEVDFRDGMTALTGETGAGKSILIDALGLVLGDRADTGMIRQGSERAEITALFDVSGHQLALEWLKTHELDQEGECLLRRVLVRNGSSRAFINGSPMPLKSLQELGDQLVNIHGQHAHHALLLREHQLALLDDYAAHQPLLVSTAEAFEHWRASKRQLDALREASQERAERLDLLRFQTQELAELKLGKNELSEIASEHRRLANADQLLELSSHSLGLLEDDNTGAQTLLSRTLNTLDKLQALDPDLSETRELVEGALIQVQEATSNLSHYADTIELDPQLLQQLDRRLAECHDMARKYRCTPEQLPDHLEALQRELEQLEDSDTRLDELELQTQQRYDEYLEYALQLETSRRQAADKLAAEVSQGMRDLSMASGQFSVELERLAESKAGRNGVNRIDYKVSTNPGQPPQPLGKIASGGELSRISLAIQVATAKFSQIPTLIFDEVDVGIGGGTAEIVGRLLRQIGQSRQVLCVTHLPQVASQAHHHLLVSKQSDKAHSHTQLTEISGESRIKEVARMLGGVEMTDRSLAHAREMLTES